MKSHIIIHLQFKSATFVKNRAKNCYLVNVFRYIHYFVSFFSSSSFFFISSFFDNFDFFPYKLYFAIFSAILTVLLLYSYLSIEHGDNGDAKTCICCLPFSSYYFFFSLVFFSFCQWHAQNWNDRKDSSARPK